MTMRLTYSLHRGRRGAVSRGAVREERVSRSLHDRAEASSCSRRAIRRAQVWIEWSYRFQNLADLVPLYFCSSSVPSRLSPPPLSFFLSFHLIPQPSHLLLPSREYARLHKPGLWIQGHLGRVHQARLPSLRPLARCAKGSALVED